MEAKRRILGCLTALGAAALLAGCTYRGEIDQPWTQKATWFSYLNGDDIRARCTAGGAEEYRLVLNADYNEQLRSYELRAEPDGGAQLTVRVQTGSGIPVNRIELADPLKGLRWTSAEARLSPAEFDTIRAALQADGLGGPPPIGLRLHSDEFYWTASGCRSGATPFHAWVIGKPGAAALHFPALLFAQDETGIPVNPPHEADRQLRHATRDEEVPTYFQLRVGADGLAQYATIF